MLRNPDSIPTGDTVIKDPAMEPYFIARSQNGGFTVYENVIKGDNNTPYIKTICYPSNFNNALKTVGKELLNNHPTKKQFSLKEYVERWESVKNSLLSVIE